MVLILYDLIFVFKNYNILILYNYSYYCDFKILFNIFSIDKWVSIPVPMSENGHPV